MQLIKRNVKKWYFIAFATALALVPTITVWADGGSYSE